MRGELTGRRLPDQTRDRDTYQIYAPRECCGTDEDLDNTSCKHALCERAIASKHCGVGIKSGAYGEWSNNSNNSLPAWWMPKPF